MYRLLWVDSKSDVNREVNNGRGPVDVSISRGRWDKTLVEMKLAKNQALKKNLQHQVKIYKRAADAQASYTVISYFSQEELARVQGILKALDLESSPWIILIDARKDNKVSASKSKES